MTNCQSCGMPMDKPEDFGGGNPSNIYCRYCTDPSGNLLPRETVKQNMTQFYTQTMGKAADEAAKEVDQIMAAMPAWQTGGAPAQPAPASAFGADLNQGSLGQSQQVADLASAPVVDDLGAMPAGGQMPSAGPAQPNTSTPSFDPAPAATGPIDPAAIAPAEPTATTPAPNEEVTSINPVNPEEPQV